MKTTTKRLLSILLAAVLALTVAMAANLPTQAATAEEITAAVTAANKETADAEARYQKAVAAVKTLAAEAENSTNGLPTCTTCPFCGVQNITWVGAAGELTKEKSTAKTNNHIYLTGDVTVAAEATFTTTNNANYTSCVFTNGYNITGEQTYVFFVGNGILNVIAMDQTGEKHSVIQGAKTGEAAGATVHSNGGGTTTQGHFYGGIYQKLNPATTANVFGGAGNSGNYLLYHTTVKAGTNGSAIYINGENGYYSNWVTLYSGTIDGSKTSDYTVHIEAGRAIAANTKYESAYTAEFRMYGGDVIGGGNSTVYMEKTPTYATTYGARGSIFSMYGGSISGGSAGSYGGNVYIAGSYTVTASASTNYKETTYTTIPVFNMYGGTISGGEAGKAATTTVTIQDLTDLRAAGGTETSINDDGTAGYGGNIYAGAGSQVTIGGNSKLENGKAYAKKTVSYSESKDTYSASIAGGGGNVYAAGASTTLNILGGTVENGWTDGCGGNIYLLSGTGEIAAGVQVLNGKAYPSEQSGAGGGNIYLSGSGAELTTAGDILDGYVKGVSSAGGNLNAGGGTTLNVTGGKIGNGTIESSRTNGKRGGAWGANIRAWNANVNISGGTIYGGRQYDYMADGELLEKRELVAQTASNVGCLGEKTGRPKLSISGDAVIVGDINTSAKANYTASDGTTATFPGTAVTLAGTPKILKAYKVGEQNYTASMCGLTIPNGAPADISGLQAGAEICVTGANNRVLTVARDDVAQLVTCFKPYYSSNCIRPNTSNQLVYYTSHSYDGGVITTEPACEATGVKTFTCGCTKTKTETVDALGHNYTAPTFAWAEDYTCQATWGCENCDETWSDACVVTAEVTKAATCYETGEEKYTAAITVDETNYTESKTKVLTTVAHTPAAAVQENVKEATCTAEGSYEEVVYCSVAECKQEISRETVTVKAEGHAWNSGVHTAPSNEKNGYTTYTCGTCGDTKVVWDVEVPDVNTDNIELPEDSTVTEDVKNEVVDRVDQAQEEIRIVVGFESEKNKEKVNEMKEKNPDLKEETPKLHIAAKKMFITGDKATKIVYDVTPMLGDQKIELGEEITFRLPVDAGTSDRVMYAYVFHGDDPVRKCEIKGNAQTGKYVVVTSQYFSEYEVVVAGDEVAESHTHQLTLLSAEEPATGCVNFGKGAVYMCTDCGKFFSDAEGEKPQDNDDPALIWPNGHELTFVAGTPATCEEDGAKDHYLCSVCGGKYEKEDDFFAGDEYDAVISKTGHSFTNYVSDNNAKPGVDGTKTATCDNGCGATETVTEEGTALPEKAVASIGASYFETVAEALENAAENDTVTLVADADEAGAVLLVMNGVTLDLNGHTLTAEYLITTSGGANVQDASNGKGLLKVAKDQLTVVDIKQLPMWVEADGGFRFVEIPFATDLKKDGEDKAIFRFYVDYKKEDLFNQLLQDGAEDNGVKIYVQASYTRADGAPAILRFYFTEEMIAKYAAFEAGVFKLTVTGLEDISQMEFAPVISYGNAKITADPLIYQ